MIDLNKKPFENCPRFERCQINKCPLHPDFLNLENDSSDPAIKNKEKCVPKSYRKKIGLAFKLKNLGLTQRELTSQKNWESLTPEQKESKIAILMKNSPVARLLEKGLTIIPPSKKQVQNPHTNSEKSSKNDIGGTSHDSN